MLSPDAERILLAKASQDAQQYPSDQAAQYIGAGVGAYVGALGPGQFIHSTGRAYEKTMDKLKPLDSPRGNRMKPGGRMAGGLVRMILGGALGPGIRNEMIGTSPAAALLAKAQSGTFNEADAYALQQVLGETYSQMGIV